MRWDGPPYAGQTFRRRHAGKQETRHVIDRTFGADVVYVYGSFRRGYQETCSYDDWQTWVAKAVLAEKG